MRAPVFLDRDGTLMLEKDYLADASQVFLEAGVIEGLALLQRHAHPLIVVSNQSGIGRGALTIAAVQGINARLDALLREQGIAILAWYFCPHAPSADCDCRKPLPGMVLTAAREWALPLAGCFVVGDKAADVQLADAVGGTGILLTTGHGRAHAAWAEAQRRPVFDRFVDAARFIVAQRGACA